MKRIFLSFLVLAISAMLTGIAGADTITISDGSYDSLQDALDNNDTVIAEGTFDIGENTLTIIRPVKLTTATGATISGSGQVLINIDLTIAGLVEIDGNNKLLSLHTSAAPPYPEEAYCIRIDHEEPFADVTIAGCEITGGGDGDVYGICNQPIYSIIKQIGNLSITGNTISNFYQSVRVYGWESLMIDHNDISAANWAVHLGYNLGPSVICDNTVSAGGFCGIGVGEVDGAQILRNKVHLNGAVFGIGIGYGSTNCVIEENKLTGSGAYSWAFSFLFGTYGDGSPYNQYNILRNNNSAELTVFGHVLIDNVSHNNLVIDNAFGGGNRVIHCGGNANTFKETNVLKYSTANTATYGVFLAATAENNLFENINLKHLTVTDSHINCGPLTKGNTFRNMQPKEPDRIVVDLGDNIIEDIE